MRIAVASGKGGTGKTLIATSLALVAVEEGPAALLDADVEEPNAALFLNPRFSDARSVEQTAPVIDGARCTHCGRCSEVCQYHAIAALPERTLVFTELCHGCGSCALCCPEGAISERAREIGRIEAGCAGPLRYAQGTLQVSEAMATPVIHALKQYALDAGWDDGSTMIVDCPPGTACPAIESLRGVDVALLVTEPTVFGLHDLILAVQVARDVLGLPVGVVMNKVTGIDAGAEAYCARERLPILVRLPMQRDIAAAYAEGRPLVHAFPQRRREIESLLRATRALAEAGQP